MQTILNVNDLSVNFDTSQGLIKAVDNISFSMERPSSAVLHVITTFAPSSANNLHMALANLACDSSSKVW